VGVVETSRVRPDFAGKRVVGEINVGCGNCSLCAAGDARHCPNRTVLGIKGRDGAHAEYLRLPERNLIEIPPEVSDDAAVFAEPLAAAFGITEQVPVERDTKVAVVGDGKLGLLCAMTMALSSDHVKIIGKHRAKLAIAERSGAEGVLLTNITSGMNRYFDVVIEASGSEPGFATALDLVRPRGKIVLKSTFHGMPKWEAWRVVVNEITIVGSRCGLIAPAIELLRSGKIRTEDLISEEYGLGQALKAMDRASEPGILKVLLTNQS
jgi:threonine dehydrogenase-like Zn-dependent dehydrogenase